MAKLRVPLQNPANLPVRQPQLIRDLLHGQARSTQAVRGNTLLRGPATVFTLMPKHDFDPKVCRHERVRLGFRAGDA